MAVEECRRPIKECAMKMIERTLIILKEKEDFRC